MKIELERDGEFIDKGTSKIKIRVSGIDYRINEDKFGRLVINKHPSEESNADSSISIIPQVSNEIIIV